MALSQRYRDQRPRPGLTIGFGGIGAEEVPDAIRRLADVVGTTRS
jgi:hypothetical protein